MDSFVYQVNWTQVGGDRFGGGEAVVHIRLQGVSRNIKECQYFMCSIVKLCLDLYTGIGRAVCSFVYQVGWTQGQKVVTEDLSEAQHNIYGGFVRRYLDIVDDITTTSNSGLSNFYETRTVMDDEIMML